MTTAIAGRHSRHPAQPRRRFGLFPVRRRGSAITDAIEAGRVDPAAVQALGELRETLGEAMPGPLIAASFAGASLEPLPREPFKPLQRPVLTEPELATLARVADRLRALPAGPGPEQAGPERDEVDLPPGAYLRAVIPGPDGTTELGEPLGRTPRFAGSARTISGRLITGMYLGTNEDGYCMIDATDPQWCEAAIAALTAMRDALVPEDDTVLLRPVPAAVNGGAL